MNLAPAERLLTSHSNHGRRRRQPVLHNKNSGYSTSTSNTRVVLDMGRKRMKCVCAPKQNQGAPIPHTQTILQSFDG